jgi:hypothetical protein
LRAVAGFAAGRFAPLPLDPAAGRFAVGFVGPAFAIVASSVSYAVARITPRHARITGHPTRLQRCASSGATEPRAQASPLA